MECLIHWTDSEEKLTKLNSLSSRETLANVARIKKLEPILKILEETEPNILPYVWYPHKCQSIFTIKKDLQYIEKEKRAANSEGTISQLTPRGSTLYAVKRGSIVRQELKRN